MLQIATFKTYCKLSRKIVVNRPYTADGLPLPTIREWNSNIDQLQAWISESSKGGQPSVLKGSVEDLISPDCGYCGSELIRQVMGENPMFIAGVIYCYKGALDQNHPQEYWADVWPVARTTRDVHNCFSDRQFKAAMRERSVARYSQSNPLIRKCFEGTGLWWHAHMGLGGSGDDIGLTYYDTPRTTRLPKPAFMHK